MKAVVFGAGKIARGFVGHLLYLSGIPFTFVENDRTLAALLIKRGRYHVEVMGNPSRSVDITGVHAVALEDEKEVARVWAEAPLGFTCVGGKNLEALASCLGRVLPQRNRLVPANSVANLITCENWKEPAALVRRHIATQLVLSDRTSFENNIGI